MNSRTCGKCAAFVPEKNTSEGGVGTCHALPPTVQLVMVPGQRTPSNPSGAPQLTAQGFWPPVRGSADFCLAWRSGAPTN